MKDNLPNYLNPHNIDPSKVEPARIDAAPGFDSIRPGMNIGTVAVVGKGRPKLQLPTMSNAEAIEVLKHIETDIYGRIAINKAIDALIGPWVKTSDRLPTEADADNTMCWVFATTISSNLPMPEAIAYIRANPDRYPYWMPIPLLTEVEE